MSMIVPAEKHVLLFTKYPTPGYAKTRMIPLLGAAGAAALSSEMTRHVLRTTREFSAKGRERVLTRVLYATNNATAEEVAEWLSVSSGEVLEPQSSGDLGDRLSAAFTRSFKEMNAEKVVVIGSDIPGITADIIRQAFSHLDEVDVVLGPCDDGGYYLLASKSPCVGVFADIPWSCANTLAVTRQRIEELGLTSCDLQVLKDVDEPTEFDVWEQVSGISESHYQRLSAD
eukprot:Plantae.Rhodophyta-Purpureofilum_apyrenoidigerum.ctg10988.p1 GENE.Plantae.Rhodophyta-Purpureofilum_apyrenoidigerum.ctg10988~~Plantae.Rhodophyta-Purpureofilum_apyrenoidigerum.ctg10988.p1  ORF type:complete len:229 (-),score=44.67 Plantae.Rhodophyta-Purpureofilum_apyrenoidigerum.ctg10988:220-906(-)